MNPLPTSSQAVASRSPQAATHLSLWNNLSQEQKRELVTTLAAILLKRLPTIQSRPEATDE